MTRVRDLTASSALTGLEKFYADDGSQDAYVTADQVKDFVESNIVVPSDMDWVNPKDYGAVADGSSHPLSQFYGTLAEAQVDFYFATSLTQQIDYCALKKASNVAFGGDLEVLGDYLTCGTGQSAAADNIVIINDGEPDMVPDQYIGFTLFAHWASAPGYTGSSPIISNDARSFTIGTNLALNDDSEYAIGNGEHGTASMMLNRPIYIPPGRYILGNDTWTIRNLASGRIQGGGKLATAILSDTNTLEFDGLWYSRISDFTIQTYGADDFALSIDGNANTGGYATRGVQGNTFENMMIAAGAACTNVCILCRLGGNSGQGSENLFMNCHWQGTAGNYSLFFINGFNALANTIIGGNFQNYDKYAFFCQGGTASIYNTGFQSTRTVDMVQNGGYDVCFANFGSFEGCVVEGCRSESLTFISNSQGVVRLAVSACVQRPSTQQWAPSTTYGPNHADGGRHGIIAYGTLFIATADGTSDTVEPDWSSGSPITDGTVTWEELPFYAVNNAQGMVDYNTVSASAGAIRGQPLIAAAQISRTAGTVYNYATTDTVFLDATNGAQQIWLPDGAYAGDRLTIHRLDGNANDIHIRSYIGSMNLIGTGYVGDAIFPPGAGVYRTYMHAQDFGGADRMVITNSNYIPDLVAPAPTTIGAETVTGYIEVSDGAGGKIKLAVVS